MRVALAAVALAGISLAADPPAAPGRALRILNAFSSQREQRAGSVGMKVTVLVETDGCEGQEVSAGAWLHASDMTPLRAAPGAPEALVGEEGCVRGGATVKSPGAKGAVCPFEIFIPYPAIVPPPAEDRRTIVVVRAACDGLFAMATFGDHLPPLAPPAPAPGLRVESVRVTPSGAGEWTVDVAFAGGVLPPGALDAVARLRTRAGAPIRAAATAPQEFRGSGGIFESRQRVDVKDEARARLRLPLSAMDLPPGGEQTLVLATFGDRGGWRAFDEREIVVAAAAPPPSRQPPPEPPPTRTDAPVAAAQIEVLHPTPEMLSKPYVGRAGSHGLQSNLLSVEAKVRGLPPGLHSLRIDLGAAGRRHIWARVEPGATETLFEGAIPVPGGPFRAALSVDGSASPAAASFEGRMELDTWAPSVDGLDAQMRAIEGRRIEGDLAALALAQAAEGYLARGDAPRAEEVARRCVALGAATPGAAIAEAEQQAMRVLASARLLAGDRKGVDEVYRAWLVRAGDDAAPRAALLREWAHLVALLSDDVEAARALWRDACAAAGRAGLPPSDPPPWFAR